MRPPAVPGLLLALSLLGAGGGPFLLAAQDQPAAEPDGRVRTELTLAARAITIAYDPALGAAAPDHAALLAGSGGPVHVATLTAHRALRIADLVRASDELEDEGPREIRRELHLTVSAGAWALEARAEEADVAGTAPVTLPLQHQASAGHAPALVAGLVPSGDDAGRLELTWGDHRWTTDFAFDELPPDPRPAREDGVGPSQDLARDSDTSAIYRRNRLADRNESALELADGSRIAILFHKEQAAEGSDFDQIATADDGTVLMLTRAAVLRLKSDVALRFGDTLIPTDNLTEGFAGMYGVWLKRAGDGWRLVFNHEADSWGTQHDPAFDAAEIPLAHGADESPARPLAATLVPTGDGTGRLTLQWGEHQWSADFTVER